jgi:hypothetical protein
MGRITNNICRKIFYYPLLFIKYMCNSIMLLFTNKYEKVYKDERTLCNLCNNTVELNDGYCYKCLESFNICINCKSIRIKKPVLKRSSYVYVCNKCPRYFCDNVSECSKIGLECISNDFILHKTNYINSKIDSDVCSCGFIQNT